MNNLKYIEQLLEIERELVVGDERDLAPKTLKRVRDLSSQMIIEINRLKEEEMILEVISKNKERMDLK